MFRHDGDNQKWVAQYDAKKAAYRFRSVSNKDLYLTWDTGKTDKNVAVWGGDGADQYWFVDLQKDGSYVLANYKDKNKVLDVEGGAVANYTNIQVYPNNGTLSQRWKMERVG